MQCQKHLDIDDIRPSSIYCRFAFFTDIDWMKATQEPKLKNLYVAIVAGSFADLSKLDLSAMGIKCYNLKKPAKLKALSAKLKPVVEDVYALYKIVLKDAERAHDKAEYLHALLPADLSELVEKGVYFDFVNRLKVLFPSDFQVHSVAEFYLDGSEIEWHGSGIYVTHYYPERYESYLYFQNKPEQVLAINGYINRYGDRVKAAPFISLAIDAYLNSFGEIPLHMSFLSLCIALESFVSGKNELIYRIRRTVSLICADSEYSARIIFKNIGKIYELRSAIVHGEKYNYALIREYLPYLRALISRTIVQLLYSEVCKPDDLQEQLNFAGFTDRKAIFQADTISLNVRSYADTLSDIVKKK